jgi:MFS family permease
MLKYASLWYVWVVTNSSEAIGLLVAAEMLPTLFFSLLGGVIADGRDRFRLVRYYQGTIAALTMLIGIVVSLSGGAYAVIFIYAPIGLVTALLLPCSFTITTSVIDHIHLSKAVSANALNFNVSALLAPLIAYVLVSTVGYSITFLLASVVMSIYIWNMLHITKRPDLVEPRLNLTLRNTVGDLYSLFRKSREVQYLLIVLFGFAMFVRPIVEQFPKLLEMSNGSANLGDIGILSIVIGVANLVANLLLSSRRQDMSFHSLIYLVAITSLLTIGVVVFKITWVVVAVIFGVSITLALSRTVILYLLQRDTAEELRGRMLSLYFGVNTGAAGIGSLIAGFLSDRQYLLYLTGTIAGACFVLVQRMTHLRGRAEPMQL